MAVDYYPDLDKVESVLINGTEYVKYFGLPTITKAPDDLYRSLVISTIDDELGQALDGDNDIQTGHEIIVKYYQEDRIGTAELVVAFRGIITAKNTNEKGGRTGLELQAMDHGYRLRAHRGRLSATSQTRSRELFLYFKDDGSGSGAPQQYARLAELRVYDPIGATYHIPREQMDTVPFSSMRRIKTGELSKYISSNEYEVAQLKKEVLFRAAQLDADSGLALPNTYVSGTPNPPASTNEDWQYKARASFFLSPEYPNRNVNANTVERKLRALFVADPKSDDGGGGFDADQLRTTHAYTKGSTSYIPDRLQEGHYVSAISGADVTVSDGGGFSTGDRVTWIDTQGLAQSGTVDSVSGDVLTLSAVPTGLVVGGRLVGGLIAACSVTLAGLGDDTDDMENYNDVLIGGNVYFIREIRDDVTLMLVNADEDDDFSGLGASGTLYYQTIEYTGIQITRLNWKKEDGRLEALLQRLEDDLITPANYRFAYDPDLNVLRGRTIIAQRGTISAVSTSTGSADITLDNVDGFYPQDKLCWRDTDNEWQEFTITEVDYSTETISVADPDSLASGMATGDIIHANCSKQYRQGENDSGLDMEALYRRVTTVATANQVFPLLNSSTTSVSPYNPQAAPTNWETDGAHGNMTDNTPTTHYNVFRSRTSSGLLDDDPEAWGLLNDTTDAEEGLPWVIKEWDLGEDIECEQLLLQIGYPEKKQPSVELVHENPAFTVWVKSDGGDAWAPCCSELIARQFDPLNPGRGVVEQIDLISKFRYVRLCCDLPFYFKVKENVFGTPTRRRDIPVLVFQVYKRSVIRYTELDEDNSQDYGSPAGQITPHLGEQPFAELTALVGTISLVGGSSVTLDSAVDAARYSTGDTVSFFDTSAAEPFSEVRTVSGVSGSVVSFTASLPAGLAAGDKIGGLRRWLRDFAGNWLDLGAPNTVEKKFKFVDPELILEEESAQNAFDGQMIAARRLYENQLDAKEGVQTAINDPHVKLFQQVVTGTLFEPEMVMGLHINGYNMSVQTRQFNVTVEEMSTA